MTATRLRDIQHLHALPPLLADARPAAAPGNPQKVSHASSLGCMNHHRHLHDYMD